MTTPVPLAAKLASFDDAWNPRIIGACNGQEVRVSKLRGPFVWHAHDGADELFLVVEGAMRIDIRDRATDPSSGQCPPAPTGGPVGGTETGATACLSSRDADGTACPAGQAVAPEHTTHIVRAGELIVIPAGVEHRPASEPEGSTCCVLTVSRAGEVNTGTAAGRADAASFTRDHLERL
ncbi:MAG: hypothetical protein RIB32_01345 [Phycisphaerales bacterium]